ncbi:MAG: response regulator [Chloroflexi bacterium]|nr:response regulator [Chloroflexota bacterium]
MARILVVDDMPVNRQYLGYVLGFASHSVLEASNGLEAFEIIRAQHPDLVITDILMPESDGIGLVKRLRDDPTISKTPVVYYTAKYRGSETPYVTSRDSVAAVLAKPSDPQEILRVVQKVLGEPVPEGWEDGLPGEKDISGIQSSLVPEASTGLRLATLIEAGLALAAEPVPQRLLEKACRAGRDIIGVGRAVIALRDAKGGWPGYLARAGVETEGRAEVQITAAELSLLNRLMEGQQPWHAADIPGLEDIIGQGAGWSRVDSFLGLRVSSPKGTLGALYLCNKNNSRPFSDEDERLAMTLAAQIALAYENAMLYAQLNELNQTLEVRVQDRSEALGSALREWRETFDAMSDAVAIVDPGGTILRANKTLASLAGTQPQFLVGRKYQELMQGKAPPADFPIARCLAERQPCDLEYRAQHMGNRWLKVKVDPIFGPDGQITSMVCNASDISDHKAADEMKDDFLDMVSHEMKTPLTVIIGGLNTVLTARKSIGKQEADQLLKDAALEAESLADIVNNLLELSRVRARRIGLALRALDIQPVIDDMVAKARRQYTEQKFEVGLPSGLPAVRADKTRVERIMYNLLDNAAKYAPSGSTVQVEAKVDSGSLLVKVIDQGPGISADCQAKLFSPFERLGRGSAGSTGGTGLGLVVCKRLVEAHGGEIGICSREGEGSTFYFTLPLDNHGQSGPASRPPQEHGQTGA